MNIEKLDAIAQKISGILKKVQVSQQLGALEAAFNNYINSPSEEHLKEINKIVGALETALNATDWLSIPRTWLIYLEEIDFKKYIGTNLVDTLKGIISNSQLSAAQGRDQIVQIKKEIDTYTTSFDQIISASKVLNVKVEKLQAGEAELGILIPRTLFDNELDRFAKQTLELHQTICSISEMATGTRESPKLRQVSTTDPIWFLALTPIVIREILKVLHMLLDAYEKVLKIKKLKIEIESAHFSQDTITKIEDEARGKMDEAIEQVISNLFKKSPVSDEGRKNELKNELSILLPKLAARIDNGVRIEAMIEPLPKKKSDAEEDAESAKLRNLIDEVAALTQRVRAYELVGEPILNLPLPTDEEPSDMQRLGNESTDIEKQ